MLRNYLMAAGWCSSEPGDLQVEGVAGFLQAVEGQLSFRGMADQRLKLGGRNPLMSQHQNLWKTIVQYDGSIL